MRTHSLSSSTFSVNAGVTFVASSLFPMTCECP